MRTAAKWSRKGAVRLLAILVIAGSVLFGVASALAAQTTIAVTSLRVDATDCHGNAVTYTIDSVTNSPTPSGTLCLKAGDPLHLTATVTGGSASGSAVFATSAANQSTWDSIAAVPLATSDNGATWTASLSWTPTTATTLAYVRAAYLPDNASPLAGSRTNGIPFSVAAPAMHNTATTLTVNGQPSPLTVTYGTSVTLSATVAPADPADTTTPTGTVTFYDGDGTSNSLGSAALVHGVATLAPTSSLAVDRHNFHAIYSGDTFYAGTTGTPPTFVLTVSAGDDQTVTTTTVIGVTPSSIRVGDGSVTFDATVTRSGAAAGPFGGQVQFEINGLTTGIPPQTLHATSDPNVFTASFTKVGGWNSPGAFTITAVYQGNTYYPASNDHTTLTVLDNQGSHIEYVGDTVTTVGAPTTLSGHLTDDGTPRGPLANRAVTLSADDQSCSAITDAQGAASCDVTFRHAGTFLVTAAFAGDATYLPATDATVLLVVGPGHTTIAYTGDTHGNVGASATLSAALTVGSTALPGKTVTLGIDGHDTCTAVTDATGLATCAVTITEAARALPYHVTASFPGDGDYLPSSTLRDFVVGSTTVTTLTYTGDTQVTTGSFATLSATLSAGGQPVAGKTVTFALASGETCSALTNASGAASCTVRVTAPAGTETVTASFTAAGYQTATVVKPFTVNRYAVRVVVLPTAPALQGASVTVSGLVATATPIPLPLSGKSVTFTVAGGSCTAVTNRLGIATCTIPKITAPIGLATVTAVAAADAYTTSASATGQVLVYGLAPGNCWFVVGDRDADDGHVNFWGAQWWKNNHLSRSSSDSSFKGFATSRSGSTWTSKPGNSSGPPAGPLPAYMAVLVSSSMSKSGSTISGDVARIVVVKTDAGYDANPGHAGTGTVVATLP